MQSFHHSRGRILFEVFCSFAISASCAGAWQQTGATALLPAAAVAALYGLVHAFDMRRPKPNLAAPSKSVELARIPEPVVPATEATFVPLAPAEQLTTENDIEQVEKAEPTPPRASRTRKTRAAPKGTRRRASAREEEKVIELSPPEQVQATEIAPPEQTPVVEVAPPDEVNVVEPTPPEDSQVAAPWRSDETSPVPLRPLFEPEPFVRQQRAAFGRKA
jgi:hypothetical protein